MTREIPLSGKHGAGKVTIVDDEDYERVSRHRWHVQTDPGTGRLYAATCVYLGGPRRRCRNMKLHRFILDAPDGVDADHRNGDGLDNTRGNLRLATRSQNNINANLHKRNTSGYRGVSLFKATGRYESYISCNRVRERIGYFLSAEEAAHARDKRAVELFGPFARLNFPEVS